MFSIQVDDITPLNPTLATVTSTKDVSAEDLSSEGLGILQDQHVAPKESNAVADPLRQTSLDDEPMAKNPLNSLELKVVFWNANT